MGWRVRFRGARSGTLNNKPDDDGGLSPDERARWVVGADGWWGSTSESPADLLKRMAGLSPSGAEVIPFRHPRLLAVGTVHDLQAQDGINPTVLKQVVGYSRAAYAGSLKWPIGTGPVETLWVRVSSNMLSLDQAVPQAKAIGCRGDLIAPYARAIARWTVQQSAEQQSDASLQMVRLMLAAAEAATPGIDVTSNGWTAWRWAADAFVEVAKASLEWVPDDALFADAWRLLPRIIAWGKRKGAGEHGLALSLLGRFLLDPYAADKPAERYDEAFARWQSRRTPTNGTNPAEPMPEPADALRQSADALWEAVGLLDGGAAAGAWKALVQALHTLAAVDPDAAAHGASDSDVIAAARSALENIDAQTHQYLIPFVQGVLADHQARLTRSGGTAPAAPAREQPVGSQSGESLALLAERVGRRQAITTGIWRFGQALDDPSRAAVILAETWKLAANHGDEELRREVLHAHLELMVFQLPDELRDRTRPLADRVTRLDTMLAGAGSAAIAAALLGLAAISGTTNEELLGLELVTRALKLDPGIREQIPVQLTYLIALLGFGKACNLGEAE